jgi:anti-sigma B factor antagonist
VNSSAAAVEIAKPLASGNASSGVAAAALLLTVVAMFVRNLIILALFAPSAVGTAAAPIVAMTLAALIFVQRTRTRSTAGSSLEIKLDSPVSLKIFLERIASDQGVRFVARSREAGVCREPLTQSLRIGACHRRTEGIRSGEQPWRLWIQPTVVRALRRLEREGVMALGITISKIDGVTVLRLTGVIYFGVESASLRLRVKELLESSRQIVLDLGSVTHIDSGGLGTLVALYSSARKVGGEIKLADPGNHAKEVLQITKLVTVFEIFERADDAAASFKRTATAI